MANMVEWEENNFDWLKMEHTSGLKACNPNTDAPFRKFEEHDQDKEDREWNRKYEEQWQWTE